MDDYYDHDEDYGNRVLWGRIIVALVAAVLLFTLGRCTAGDGASSEELATLRAQVTEFASENSLLEERIAAQADGGGEGGTDGTEATEPVEATEPPAEGEGEGDGGGEGQDPTAEGNQTYVVESGDTLTGIAEQFYGDPRGFQRIVDANNLTSSTPLRVGQELIIPPEE